MAATGNYCFWLVYFYKSSLKPHGQIMQNLAGSIYGRSSRFSHFILIGQKHGHHGQFLFLIGWNFKKYSPLKLGGTVNCYFVGMMYVRSCSKCPIFCADHTINMVVICSSLKPFGKINWNSVGSTYGRLCIKFPQTKWEVSDTGSSCWASSFFSKYQYTIMAFIIM